MARKIIRGKPSKSLFMDAIGIALIKTIEERLLASVIGNGTFISGIAKGAIAFILPTVAGNNKWTNLGATAFMIDSAEDLVNAGINYVGFGGSTERGLVI